MAGREKGPCGVGAPGLALPLLCPGTVLSCRTCHRGCALGIQLVSPSVLPAQGCKTLWVITGSYLFLKSLGARGEVSVIYIKIALECVY